MVDIKEQKKGSERGRARSVVKPSPVVRTEKRKQAPVDKIAGRRRTAKVNRRNKAKASQTDSLVNEIQKCQGETDALREYYDDETKSQSSEKSETQYSQEDAGGS